MTVRTEPGRPGPRRRRIEVPAPANSEQQDRQCTEADREGRRKAESISGHDQAGHHRHEQRAEPQGDTPDEGQPEHGDGRYRYEHDTPPGAGRRPYRRYGPEAGSQAKTRIDGQQHHGEDQSYSGPRPREVQEVNERRYTGSQRDRAYTLGRCGKNRRTPLHGRTAIRTLEIRYRNSYLSTGQTGSGCSN